MCVWIDKLLAESNFSIFVAKKKKKKNNNSIRKTVFDVYLFSKIFHKYFYSRYAPHAFYFLYPLSVCVYAWNSYTYIYFSLCSTCQTFAFPRRNAFGALAQRATIAIHSGGFCGIKECVQACFCGFRQYLSRLLFVWLSYNFRRWIVAKTNGVRVEMKEKYKQVGKGFTQWVLFDWGT